MFCTARAHKTGLAKFGNNHGESAEEHRPFCALSKSINKSIQVSSSKTTP